MTILRKRGLLVEFAELAFFGIPGMRFQRSITWCKRRADSFFHTNVTCELVSISHVPELKYMHIKYDVSDNLLNKLIGKWITKFETISRVAVKCYWGGPLRG